MGRSLLALVLVAALASASCGTSRIVASDPSARILVDGRVVGRGQGELTRIGPPGSSVIQVKTDDGREQQQVVHRSFTIATFVVGLFTYGVCLIACWTYPDTVFMQLPPPMTPYAPPGAPVAADPWLQPPPGWQPK
jgi:hypothetical protein